VNLSIIGLPDRRGGIDLYAGGYPNNRSIVESALILAFSHPPQWWESHDQGITWKGTQSPVPFGESRTYLGTLPKVTSLDETQTLGAVTRESGKQVFLRSVDGGKHWTKRILPVDSSSASGQLVTDTKGHIVIVFDGTFGSGTVILWSNDFGATWNENRTLGASDYHLFHGSGILLAYNYNDLVGARTVMHHSLDNGRTWNESMQIVKNGEHGAGRYKANQVPLQFVAGNGLIIGIADGLGSRVVAVTDLGKILLSDDGGISWRSLGKVTENGTGGISAPMLFSGEGIVVAMLNGGIVLRSTDRGETWTVCDSKLRRGDATALYRDERGLIVAAGGGLLTRSTDWGATWELCRVEAPPTE
jgi:photosystem II stability/assembly factor-like uncharacterized protein